MKQMPFSVAEQFKPATTLRNLPPIMALLAKVEQPSESSALLPPAIFCGNGKCDKETPEWSHAACSEEQESLNGTSLRTALAQFLPNITPVSIRPLRDHDSAADGAFASRIGRRVYHLAVKPHRSGAAAVEIQRMRAA